MTRPIVALAAAGLAVALLVPSPAEAHAPLTSTTPADGEELSAPPDEVVMVFDGELDPEQSGFVVTDAAGAEVGTGGVDLQIADRNEMRGEVEISEPGTYTVSWMTAAADGHREDGSFTFTVADDRALGSDAEAPNTAAEPAGWPIATVVGLGMLTAAIVTGARRLAVVRA